MKALFECDIGEIMCSTKLLHLKIASSNSNHNLNAHKNMCKLVEHINLSQHKKVLLQLKSSHLAKLIKNCICATGFISITY